MTISRLTRLVIRTAPRARFGARIYLWRWMSRGRCPRLDAGRPVGAETYFPALVPSVTPSIFQNGFKLCLCPRNCSTEQFTSRESPFA